MGFKTKTVQIPLNEYRKLKKVDWNLVQSFKRSLEDLRAGRVTKVK